MYQIIVVTMNPEILSTYEKITDWSDMGLLTPVYLRTVSEAKAYLKAHKVDAISYRLEDSQSEELHTFLDENFPAMPIFHASAREERLREVLREAKTILNRLHADFSDETYSEDEIMYMLRREFISALMEGKVQKPLEVRSRMKMLRCKADIENSVFLVDMEIPAGDLFLSDRWRYGEERLEVALNNFFGKESENIIYYLSMPSAKTLRLLAMPRAEARNADTSVTAVVSRHVNDSIDKMRDMLELEVRVVGVEALPNLMSLAIEGENTIKEDA